MKIKEFKAAIESIVEVRKIDEEIVEEAIIEALGKALKRHIGANEANVKVVMDEETDEIRMYQVFEVVEEVENFDTQLSLEEALDDKEDAEIGDEILLEHDVTDLGRPAALLAKNVLKQKIREGEKQSVYDEYIHQLYEMVTVSVETVEDRFLFVNLGRAHGIMPLSQQIPGEHYYEGQKLKVVITEVNRDTKGAQIIVSRSDDHFVRRLFEMEVPEIYQGIVEIKAIAREAGNRTKIAVYSKDDEIDPIGACIGPRGTRVQEVIEELQGEKIDIFEWSDDIDQLIKSSLAPADVLYVLPTDDERSVIVVVDDEQLSLAIGRGGKNAKLAVKLINRKIDIKPLSEIIESGIDYKALALANQEVKSIIEDEVFDDDLIEDIIEDVEEETIEVIADDIDEIEDEIVEDHEAEEDVVEVDVIEDADVEVSEEVVETAKKPEVKAPKERVERTVKDDYVSKFEKLADPTVALAKIAKEQEEAARRRARYARDNNEEVDLSDLEYEIIPEYSDEEMEEIERQQEELESSWYDEDIDFDEFEDYYED